MPLVRIRPLALADVDNVMTWVNDPAIVGNFAAFSGKAFTRDEERSYVEKLLASQQDRVFSIERAEDGAYLGQVGIHQIHWPSKVGRLACIISSRGEMGKGYGTAAISCALDWAFQRSGATFVAPAPEAKLHKVWLMVFETNARARAVYSRLGFQKEGVLREEYFHRESWHDMIRMSILDREWLARGTAAPS